MKFLIDKTLEAVDRLGILGTITFVGAIVVFVAVFFVNFNMELAKGISFLIIGTALLVFSAIMYVISARETEETTKEALTVLGGVYNRLAEASPKGTNEQAVSITMTIDNLPDKIKEVIKKSRLI